MAAKLSHARVATEHCTNVSVELSCVAELLDFVDHSWIRRSLQRSSRLIESLRNPPEG
jgi:hypothetical protein